MLARSYPMHQVISLQNLQSRQTQDKMEVLSGRLHLSLSYVLSSNRDYCPVIVLGKCFLNLSGSINCRIFLYNSRFKTLCCLFWTWGNTRLHWTSILSFVSWQIHFIEEQKQLVHSIREQEIPPQESALDMDSIVDAKLQRNELMLKQQKQDHYKNNLQALLKKLKEEEKLLAKVLNTIYVVFGRGLSTNIT